MRSRTSMIIVVAATLAAAAAEAGDKACKRDQDCVLELLCSNACPPCRPIWRRVYNRKALARDTNIPGRIRCPARKCRACRGTGYWRGTRAICREGLCRVDKRSPLPEASLGYLVANTHPQARVFVDGKDSGKSTPVRPSEKIPLRPGRHTITFVSGGKRFRYTVTIKPGSTARLVKKLAPDDADRIPPRRPWTRARTCRRHGDCVILAPNPPCTCRPCGRFWNRAINAKHARTRRKCPPLRCPACVRLPMGRAAVCVRGQCTVRP